MKHTLRGCDTRQGAACGHVEQERQEEGERQEGEDETASGEGEKEKDEIEEEKDDTKEEEKDETKEEEKDKTKEEDEKKHARQPKRVRDVKYAAVGPTLSTPHGLAHDSRTNRTYIADYGNDRIAELDHDSGVLRTFAAVVLATNVMVVPEGHRTPTRFLLAVSTRERLLYGISAMGCVSSYSLLRDEGATPGLCGLAMDSRGRVLVSDRKSVLRLEFDCAGASPFVRWVPSFLFCFVFFFFCFFCFLFFFFSVSTWASSSGDAGAELRRVRGPQHKSSDGSLLGSELARGRRRGQRVCVRSGECLSAFFARGCGGHSRGERVQKQNEG
jgi:hypothetical protein